LQIPFGVIPEGDLLLPYLFAHPIFPSPTRPTKKHVFHRNFFFCNISHHPAFI
jgi:hypothetical protein